MNFSSRKLSLDNADCDVPCCCGMVLPWAQLLMQAMQHKKKRYGVTGFKFVLYNILS